MPKHRLGSKLGWGLIKVGVTSKLSIKIAMDKHLRKTHYNKSKELFGLEINQWGKDTIMERNIQKQFSFRTFVHFEKSFTAT